MPDSDADSTSPDRKRTWSGPFVRRTGKQWRFQTPRGWTLLAWALLLVAITIDVIVVGQHTLGRYQAFNAGAFDLGNIDQTVWNTLHGHPFRMTNRGGDVFGPPTRLSIHVEPILLLIAPLYLIHSGPETLLILQTVALALGAIPLFMLGLRRMPRYPFVALAIAGAYLVAPELLGEVIWDFHPVALATPLLLLALWAFDARRYGWLVVAATLAALTKEDVALSLVPIGLYLAFGRRRYRLGLGMTVASLAWVFICFRLIMPAFTQDVSGNNYWYRYAWLGDTPQAAVGAILTQPGTLLGSFFDPDRLAYLGGLLRTGGGLGLFAPVVWVCALPELAINLLSSHEQQYSGIFHYNAQLVAYLMAASVYGAAALLNARQRHAPLVTPQTRTATRPLPPALPANATRVERAGARLSPVAGALRRGAQHVERALLVVRLRWRAALALIPVPSRLLAPALIGWLVITSAWNLAAADPRLQGYWNAGTQQYPGAAQVNALLATIPPDASVATTDSLNPHLSARYTLYLMPDPQSYLADYVAADIPDAGLESQDDDQAMLDAMKSSGRYTVVGVIGPVIVLHRTGPPLPPSTASS